MKKIASLIVCLVFVGFNAILAQDIQISGNVTSADDGSSLPGVSVVVKGTSVGAATDINGNYSITAPGDATLVFSSVGMRAQEIAVAGQTVIDVVLETEAVEVAEVVVTALGISRDRKALGYSIQNIDGDEVAQGQYTNVINAIGSRVTGVQVTNTSGAAGAASYMIIRGQASLTRDNDPLFVIDGVPIDNQQLYSGNPDNLDNNLNDGVSYSNRAIDINPEDIESVSVLKGGAATALYGLRAANGAVIITTKRGKATPKGKVNVTFSSSLAVDKITQMPGLQKTFAQGYDGEWYGPDAGWPASWGPRIDTMAFDGSDYAFDRNGALVSANDPSAVSPAKAYDNVDNFFKTGITTNNSLSLSGGNESSSFYMSVGHQRTDGVIPNNVWSKATFLLNGETKIWNNFSIFGSANYINSGGDRIQQGSNVSGIMLGLLRTPPTFDNANGYDDPVNTVEAYEFADGSQRNYRGGGGYDNPFWSVNKNILTDDVNRVIGHVGLRYTPFTWMSVQYKLGTDVYTDRRDYYFGINSRQFPSGQVTSDNHFNKDINSDLIVTLNKNIGTNWAATAIIGHNMYSTLYQQVYTEGNGLTVPEFYHISNASSYINREEKDEKRTAAFYGDFGISFKDMVFVDVTGRQEWSTSMPKGSNSFFYPSVNAGFVFTEIPALADNNILSFGKLRAAYAVNAYDADVYSTADVYQISNISDGWTITGLSYPFVGVPGFSFNDVAPSKDLKPEKLTNMEFGADLRFLNSRLTIDVSYFENKSEDLLLQVPFSGAMGYSNIYMNAGTMENKGIELTVGITPVKTSIFTWNALVNFTKIENKVIELAEGVENVSLGGFTGSQVRAVAGEPYGNVYGDSWLRYDENGDDRAQPEEPIIVIDDPDAWNYGYPEYSPEEIVVGNIQPDWLMGITNTFTLKDLTINALIDIRKGGDIWNGTRGALYYFGTHEDTEDRETATRVFAGYKGHWDEDGELVYTGQVNDIESPLNQGWYIDGEGSGFTGPSEQFVEDGGWVRLKELTVSYDFRGLLQNTFLRNGATLYFTGRNLWIQTDYKGVDPETSLYGAHNAQGMDYFNMPGTKSYIFGLRVAF